jgi:hypothetical protein
MTVSASVITARCAKKKIDDEKKLTLNNDSLRLSDNRAVLRCRVTREKLNYAPPLELSLHLKRRYQDSCVCAHVSCAGEARFVCMYVCVCVCMCVCE